MKSRWLQVLLAVMLTAGSSSSCTAGGGSGQGTPANAQATQVLAGVPDPDDDAIRDKRDAKEWSNPYVIVNRDGYELILPGRPRTAERSDLAELEHTLLSLSREQWPLGRVVAVQENAIRSQGDDERIASNLKALKQMLESHKVRADLWPSA
jgi:hypothetical protein